MSFACTRMSFVCHSYVIRMYSYGTRMSSVCTRMSFVCHSYVLACHSYVTRMSFVCQSYVFLPWTIGKARFDECFLFYVIILRHYSLYKFIVQPPWFLEMGTIWRPLPAPYNYAQKSKGYNQTFMTCDVFVFTNCFLQSENKITK